MKEFFTILPGGKSKKSVTENEANTILNSAKPEYKCHYSEEELYLYEADTNPDDDCCPYSVAIAVKIAGEWHSVR